MFRPVDPKVSFPRLEEGILAFWEREGIFRRSVEERPEDRLFVFYEGPPTANGRPGIHHVLARAFKDLVPRFKTMQGYRVPRKAGWDTHGLPVELEVETELGLRSKPDIEAYGIAAFNQKCKESVGRYVDEWKRLSDRIAFWADMENPYVTWHNEYIETCWWIFKQMWDHGLVYQDYRSTPHCPRCGTSLSDHEVSLGYEEDTPDPSVFIKFRVASSEFREATGFDAGDWPLALVAWTTTPWTLPGNTALAAKADASYGIFEHEGEYLVVAEALGEGLLGEGAKPVATVPGEKLAGLAYEPLYMPENTGDANVLRFDAEGRLRPLESSSDGLRRVITADYVSLDDGSGIVHIAPAFGSEDFEEGKRYRLLFVQHVDGRGLMATGVPGAGTFVKDADREVSRDLQERGLLLRETTIKHTYPFCWRCKTPLLYYAKPSWYIRTTKHKDKLLEGNARMNWHPKHLQNGRYGNWLENNIDWAFSRERYWGTPLPFWECQSCGRQDCIGSRTELAERAIDRAKAEALDDLHRPYIDDIVVRCSGDGCAGEMRRVPEVADAWFDSGAMPYAQWHYPFENEDEFLRYFPADFICEAIDQTRGWFYTLHAEAAMLHASEAVPDSISYRNVISLGHILDEQGNKMSKSRGNVVEPWDVLDRFGADATRWYMYTASPAGSPRRFSGNLVEEGLRRFLLTLWNTYSFFVSYANIDKPDPRVEPQGPAPEIDRWLLSELNVLVETVTRELEDYEPTNAARAIDAFVDDLSNWYVRRSRRRFWRGAGEDDNDKQSAYHTLYTALVTVTKLLAPFTPFVAEEMWQNLARSVDPGAAESVHLADWPVADASKVDRSLNGETQLVKRVCSLGRAARAKAQIKVRQPVAEVAVKARSSSEIESLQRNEALILDELNAKALRPVEDESAIVRFEWKPNLPVLGRKYGSGVADIRKGLAGLDLPTPSDAEPRLREALERREAPAARSAVVEAVRTGRSLEVAGYTLEPEDILLEPVDAEGYASATEAGYTVAVTTEITPELADEGLAREIVRRLQDLRREAGFDLSDRITAWYQGDGDLDRVAASFGDYIRAETLATELIAGAPPEDATSAAQKVDGVEVVLGVRRKR